MENAKLAINLSEGTVQVEGSEELVRFIYQDFKDHLSKKVMLQPARASSAIEHAAAPTLLVGQSTATESKPSVRKSTGAAHKKADGDSKAKSNDYRPQFNTKLDLTGLAEAFDEWVPVNNFEKILLFAVFLRDRLNIAPCTADDIYTCFATLSRKGKTKVPEAFVQAFRDAQHRTNFIELKSLQEIVITIPGDNHYNEKKKKVAQG